MESDKRSFRLCFPPCGAHTSVSLFPGCEQEKHHGGGVVGRKQNKTVLHARHGKKRFRFIHMGFPKNQPSVGREHKEV